MTEKVVKVNLVVSIQNTGAPVCEVGLHDAGSMYSALYKNQLRGILKCQ